MEGSVAKWGECLEQVSRLDLSLLTWVAWGVGLWGPFCWGVGALGLGHSPLTPCPLHCRPLWVEYPDDTTTFSMDDQYLIGESPGMYWGGNMSF